MKLPLTKEIEDSAKGIYYVNSLVPSDKMMDISNNIPKLSRKFKRQQNHFAMFIFICVALGIVLSVALIIYLILEKL